MSRNQDEAAQALSQKLRDAESDAVKHILAGEPTMEKCCKAAWNAHGFADAMVDKHRHPESPPVACRDRCHWCCYQTIVVAAPEVLRIVEYLATELNEQERADIVHKLRELDKRTRNLTSEERDKLRAPCAFLRGKRCSVYPVRPMACAGFTSYKVADCKKAYKHGFKEDSVVSEIATRASFRGVFHGLIDGIREKLPEGDSGVLELTAAVLDALDCESIVEQWREGRSVFDRAHRKAEAIDRWSTPYPNYAPFGFVYSHLNRLHS